MFKIRRSEKPSKTHCPTCKSPFDKLTNPRKQCAVCQDFYFCATCLIPCAECPVDSDCYLCPSFHPHECVWPECGKSLCQMHGLDNPLSFALHDKRICICEEHKERVVKRMEGVVGKYRQQSRKRLLDEEKND